MDRETRERIQKLNANAVPDNLRKKLIQNEARYTPEQKELVYRALEHKDTPQEHREKIRAAIDEGALDAVDQKVDPKVAKAMEERVEGKIKAAIARGDLPKPDGNDEFHKMVLDNMERHAKKKPQADAPVPDSNFGHIATG